MATTSYYQNKVDYDIEAKLLKTVISDPFQMGNIQQPVLKENKGRRKQF